jgi:hypothetical protein
MEGTWQATMPYKKQPIKVGLEIFNFDALNKFTKDAYLSLTNIVEIMKYGPKTETE